MRKRSESQEMSVSVQTLLQCCRVLMSALIGQSPNGSKRPPRRADVLWLMCEYALLYQCM
jgi:hypothetical protein